MREAGASAHLRRNGGSAYNCGMKKTVVLKTSKKLTVGEGPVPALTPIGLVVSEHVDKLAFLEPGVAVIAKTVRERELEFVLDLGSATSKPLEEIVRGFRIGCFRIAREYHLVSPGEPPLFE